MLLSSRGSNFRTPRVFYTLVSVALALVAVGLILLSVGSRPADEGVYRIVVKLKGGGGATGSGFKVADPGYVVTNHHVIDGGRNISIAYLKDDDIHLVPAKIVWFNTDKDLAILKAQEKLPSGNVTLASIGTEELDKVQSVTAIGFPGVADRIASSLRDGVNDKTEEIASYLDPTVSIGAIQRLVPTIQRLTIQHSANINSGNSGGPLFDGCKRVIGVNTLGATSYITASDLAGALTKGSAKIQSSGDLEFAVHVKEVLSGLKEKDISFSSTPGRCRGSFDVYEIGMIGASTLFAIGAGLMAGFAPASRRGNLGGNRIDDEFDPFTSETPQIIQGTGLLEIEEAGYTIEDKASGETLASFGSAQAFVNGGQIIGRTSDKASILVSDASVSRQHAIIRAHGDGFVIHDCDSTNGTSCNGQMVSKTQGRELSDGATIKVGDVDLVFKIGQSVQQQTGPAIPSSFMLSGFDSQGRILQHRVDGAFAASGAGNINEVASIGRDRANSFVINDNTISRRHASLGVDSNGQLVVADLGSSNGTFIGGQSVGRQPVAVALDQTIAFGDTKFTISRLNS